jgi:hypothetical protein
MNQAGLDVMMKRMSMSHYLMQPRIQLYQWNWTRNIYDFHFSVYQIFVRNWQQCYCLVLVIVASSILFNQSVNQSKLFYSVLEDWLG